MAESDGNFIPLGRLDRQNATAQDMGLLDEAVRRARIRAHIAKLFVRTPGARIRRTEVYNHVAQADGLEVQTPPWRRRVMMEARALGAVPVKGAGAAFFRHFARRDRPWEPPPMRDQDVGRLQRAWYARLRDEGFEDIEHIDKKTGERRLQELPHFREYAEKINGSFFRNAAAAYWQWKKELDMWGMYVLEGLTIRAIEEKTGVSRYKVHAIVTRWRKLLDGQPADGDGDE